MNPDSHHQQTTKPPNTPDESIPFWKRAIDVSCCVVALPILIVATFGLGIHLAFTSRGPLFFKQERVGRGGSRFKLYKFRTMHTAAPTASHQVHFAELVRSNTSMEKLDTRGDARLIPGAWLLRCSGLDELPQIVNILRGEMSIVGPRPCIPYEYEQYNARQRERFACLPGLTGLWQVSGKNRTTFDEMIRLDVEYTRTSSPVLDLKIIALTVPALCLQYIDVQKSRRGIRAKTALRRPGPSSAPI